MVLTGPAFPEPSARVDAVGSLCPIPVRRTAETIRSLARGEVLELLADDGMALVDLPSWCFSWRHEYLGHERRGPVYHLFIRKGDGAGPPRAVGLMSGGLDSTLAAEMLRRQGVDVTGLHFVTGFCKIDHRRAIGRAKDRGRNLRNEALRAGADLDIPVEIVDVSEQYLREVVLEPRYGYGAHMNPCIDCRIFMLRKAGEYADAIGAQTVFTGEVIGQRPFSQHREAMRVVEQKSGLAGRLLRPLSAQHLPPTRGEAEGRIDRARLGRIGGRSRRAQEALAKEYGIAEYPQPSGGCCYLADPAYARRLRDLLAHGGGAAIDAEDVLLLKIGRQFRLSAGAKLHVGREEVENEFLRRFAAGRWLVEAPGVEGPTGILCGAPSPREMGLAASIVARYADLEGASEVDLLLTRQAASGTGLGTGPVERMSLRVAPAVPADLEPLRL